MNENSNNGGQSGLGIAALILSILGCTFIIGLILAIVDLTSKNGKSKTLSKISLGICGAWLVIGIIGAVLRSGKDDNTGSQSNSAVEATSEDELSEDTTESIETADEDSNVESDQSDETKTEAKFENDKIITDAYTIEILEYKIIQPGEEGNKYGDKPVIAFWYNTTNTSGEEIDPNSAWIYIVKAVQDNNSNMVNELNVAMLPDDAFTDSQMAKIKKDGTVENAVAYELTDMETPVVLTATNGLFGNEIGSQTFDIK